MTPIFTRLQPILAPGYVVLYDAGPQYGCVAGGFWPTRSAAQARVDLARRDGAPPFAIVRVIPKPGCEGARIA